MDESGVIGTPDPARNLPNVWRTVLRGGWLGIQSSLVGSLVFLIAVWLLVSLVDPRVDIFDVGTVDAELLFWLIVFSLAGFVVAVVPGTIGGSIIGLVLRVLAHRGRLSAGIGAATGIFVGVCSGCLAIQLTNWLAPAMVQQSSIEAFIAAILSATLAGLWHSWRFTRWLQKVLT